MSKNTAGYLKELEAAIFDLLDGNYEWYDIKADTGLSEERCREIEALYKDVRVKYKTEYGV